MLIIPIQDFGFQRHWDTVILLVPVKPEIVVLVKHFGLMGFACDVHPPIFAFPKYVLGIAIIEWVF